MSTFSLKGLNLKDERVFTIKRICDNTFIICIVPLYVPLRIYSSLILLCQKS